MDNKAVVVEVEMVVLLDVILEGVVAVDAVVDVALAYRGVAIFADPDSVDLDHLERHLRATLEVVGEAEEHEPGDRLVLRVPVDAAELVVLVAARLVRDAAEDGDARRHDGGVLLRDQHVVERRRHVAGHRLAEPPELIVRVAESDARRADAQGYPRIA